MLRRFLIAVAIILVVISAAGCYKVYYHRFFFYTHFMNEWNAYARPNMNSSIGFSPEGMALDDVLAVSKYAFSYNFTMTVEFQTNIDEMGPVERFYLYFLDRELQESESLFVLGFEGIGDETGGFSFILEDTIAGAPRIIYEAEAIPATMLLNDMNELIVQRTGKIISCSLNGAAFAEGELENFQSGFVVPMFDADQKDGDPAEMMSIRSFKIAYDGEKRKLPLTASVTSGKSHKDLFPDFEQLFQYVQ